MKTSFRLVCATNRDLEDLVRHGRFRLDLYHRIAGWAFRTLPLSERREDIPPLARHFLQSIIPDTPAFDDQVSHFLVNRDYAGNIRELRQLVERIAHRHASPGPITVGDIPEDDRPSDDAPRTRGPTSASNEASPMRLRSARACGTSAPQRPPPPSASRSNRSTATFSAPRSASG
jgi:DNA-binding NtrC family response regulator